MAKAKSADEGVQIKYLGDSDVRTIEAGEDWGGRLAEPLAEDLVWNWDNNHLLSVDISPEAMELLLEDPEFRDVTGAKTIPVAAVAKRRRAISETRQAVNESGVGGTHNSPGDTTSELGTGTGSTTSTSTT